MRTTFPRRLFAVSGGELSHSVALLRDDSSPSTDSGVIVGIILCNTLWSWAKVPIEGTPALASMAASTSLFTFMMRGSCVIASQRCVAPAVGKRRRRSKLLCSDDCGVRLLRGGLGTRLGMLAAVVNVRSGRAVDQETEEFRPAVVSARVHQLLALIDLREVKVG